MTSRSHKGAGLLRVGCSGFQYKHWRGDFYPADLPQHAWLEHYAATFDTVEINNSFYRLPEAITFRRWAERTPSEFLFAVKASRFLTHMKKLKDPEEPLTRLFEHARGLGRKLGPMLYQLPPRWPVNLVRFQEFVKLLPAHRLHAIEFRDPTWYAEAVLSVMQKAGVAMCLHDMTGSSSPRQRVGPFIYARFHGTQRYGGRYDDQTLAEWADWLAGELERGVDVYAYFNNDIGGHAPRDAVRLREAIEQR